MRLAGKHAIITGAGSGIGRASALLFAQEGASIVAADINLQSAEATARDIRQQGGKGRGVACDVTKASDIDALIETARQQFHQIDIVFNNAGVPMAFTPLEEVTEDLWDTIMAVNVKSLFLMCRAVIPIMKDQQSGVILNTSSTAAVRPRPGLTPYNASKGAVSVLTGSLALELAPFHIRVNAINPVAVDTPMLNEFIGAPSESGIQAGRQQFADTIPLGRLATPRDIAFAALYLASDEAALVTGTCLDVAGGRTV
ncbi:MAG: glucose 1-dehydrogenase [Thermaerobacter sp.]|nr:glucose 1-dehydrogenase [Thermaerobacter sp.]